VTGVVKEIQNNVGQLTGVRSVILSGGGAALYAPSIRKAFPRVTLEVVRAPCFANSEGFLIVGEAGITRERAAARA
jgi:plasmid segregation protein ParM